MKTMQLREAKARFSALVDAAENGEPTLVTRHGRAVAMLVPIEEGQRLFANENKPDLVDYLMSMPAEIPLKRNRSRARSVKF